MTDRLLRRSLAELQGSLFALSGREGYDSERFIRCFMRSRIAAGLDSDFDFMQWCGKEYILERMQDELPEALQRGGEVYSDETLYWIGYLYRCWHFRTGEDSRTIYRTAGARRLSELYYAYHTLDIDEAIDRLREA